MTEARHSKGLVEGYKEPYVIMIKDPKSKKKRKYKTNIELRKDIKELKAEIRFLQSGNSSNSISKEILRLKKENKELREAKQRFLNLRPSCEGIWNVFDT